MEGKDTNLIGDKNEVLEVKEGIFVATKETSETSTLGDNFDELENEFHIVVDSESTPELQEDIGRLIKKFENLTRDVSSVGIFSRNEMESEIKTGELKFLQLPYYLGSLWQLRMTGDRIETCRIAHVYFKDFLQRLFDYGIRPNLPTVTSIDVAIADDEEDDKEKKQVVPPKITSDNDIRNAKIQAFKMKKELDQKIAILEDRQKDAKDLELDDTELRDLYLLKVRRANLEADSEMDCLAREVDMIEAMEKFRKGDKPEKWFPKKKIALPHPVFIVTKTDLQKKVYGAGYPSLPVMTVDEFYKDREAKGEWGPSASASKGPGGITADDVRSHGKPIRIDVPDTDEAAESAEAAVTEEAEERDDPDLLASRRQWDDYQDTHRPGWGNTYNRS